MNLQPLLEPNWIQAIAPEIILTVSGLVLILLDAFVPRGRAFFAQITVLALIAAAFAELSVPRGLQFGGTYEISGITLIFDLIFILATLLATLLSREYLQRERIEGGEYYALLLWGTVGMMMMGKGLELLVVILGLELLSICIFVLTGYHRRIPISNEASLKYFLMAAFATGFVLYGTALIYGQTGSTALPALAAWFAAAGELPVIVTVAVAMLLGGFGFKLALVPFHAWAPDVYQGAPTPISGWLSVAPKAATLLALVRVWHALSAGDEPASWKAMVGILAALSMILGNLVAIAQRDLKRMLAYSGIAHVGYMMIAVYVLSEASLAAIAIYAVAYSLMNLGAFGVVSLLQKNQNDPQTLDDIAGLGFRHPFYGLALALAMISLAGIPLTAGFIGKYYLFTVAIREGAIWLALIGIVMSIVSVYYYLRVIYYMYMKEADGPAVEPQKGIFSVAALTISMLGILIVGIQPTPLFRGAIQAAAAVLGIP